MFGLLIAWISVKTKLFYQIEIKQITVGLSLLIKTYSKWVFSSYYVYNNRIETVIKKNLLYFLNIRRTIC